MPGFSPAFLEAPPTRSPSWQREGQWEKGRRRRKEPAGGEGEQKTVLPVSILSLLPETFWGGQSNQEKSHGPEDRPRATPTPVPRSQGEGRAEELSSIRSWTWRDFLPALPGPGCKNKPERSLLVYTRLKVALSAWSPGNPQCWAGGLQEGGTPVRRPGTWGPLALAGEVA